MHISGFQGGRQGDVVTSVGGRKVLGMVLMFCIFLMTVIIRGIFSSELTELEAYNGHSSSHVNSTSTILVRFQ